MHIVKNAQILYAHFTICWTVLTTNVIDVTYQRKRGLKNNNYFVNRGYRPNIKSFVIYRRILAPKDLLLLFFCFHRLLSLGNSTE